MRIEILECDVCGQKNRVDLDRPPEKIVCGNCKESMEDEVLDFLAAEADEDSLEDEDIYDSEMEDFDDDDDVDDEYDVDLDEQ